jgi:hypothetical protein
MTYCLGMALGAKDIQSLLMRRTLVGAYAVFWFGMSVGPLCIGYHSIFGFITSYVYTFAAPSLMCRNSVSKSTYISDTHESLGYPPSLDLLTQRQLQLALVDMSTFATRSSF